MMKLFNCMIMLLLWQSSAHAVSLSQMQKMALSDRQVVQKNIAELEQSQQDITRARSSYYPAVDIGYTSVALDEANPTESDQHSRVFGLVTYNLFAGFRDKYNVKSAESLKTLEEYKLEGIRQDIQLDVALAYLNVYERLANRRVAESAYDTLKKLYQDGESRYEVGLIDKNDLLKFQVDFDNADITLQAADASLRKSVNDLSREVGTRIDFADLDFKDFEELPLLFNLEQYRQKMLLTRSEIKVFESLIQSNTALVGSEKSEYYPEVDLIGSYRRYDENYVNGFGDSGEDELRAELVLTMNLFRGYNTEATVAKAKLETRAVQYELDELKNSLQNSLDNIYIDFEVSLDNVEIAKRSIEQAEENLRITQLKYDEGLQRESDLLDAVTNLSRAQYNDVLVIRTVFLNDFEATRMVNGF